MIPVSIPERDVYVLSCQGQTVIPRRILPCSYHVTLNHHILLHLMKLFRYLFRMVSQDIFYYDRENLINKISFYEEVKHLQFISQNSGQSIYTTATLPFSPSTSIVMLFFFGPCVFFISKLEAKTVYKHACSRCNDIRLFFLLFSFIVFVS